VSVSEKKTKGPPRLSLEGPQKTRATLARLTRMRFRGEIASDVYRDCIYGLSVALGFDKHLADLRLDARLDELEARIQDHNAQAFGPGGRFEI
jgi:hypothetical protein